LIDWQWKVDFITPSTGDLILRLKITVGIILCLWLLGQYLASPQTIEPSHSLPFHGQ